jgi:hypothetical protein
LKSIWQAGRKERTLLQISRLRFLSSQAESQAESIYITK